jgi:hypothetical protein
MTRYRYVTYGLAIESELRLLSIDEDREESSQPAIRIVMGSADWSRELGLAHPSDDEDWILHSILPDGSIYIRAENVFEAVISRDGRDVTCRIPDSVDRRSVEANLLNFVVSASLTLQGEEPLHATVVDLGGRAVGLLGLSGAGKSTLAACLIGRGADLVTDDMLRVKFDGDLLLAWPGPYRLKLFDDALQKFLAGTTPQGHFNPLSGKVMLQPRATIPTHRLPIPLSCLFHLGDPDQVPPDGEISASRMTGADLAIALISSTMDDRYAAADRLTRQMAFVSRVSRTLPVYALRYPRRFDIIDQVTAVLRRTGQL